MWREGVKVARRKNTLVRVLILPDGRNPVLLLPRLLDDELLDGLHVASVMVILDEMPGLDQSLGLAVQNGIARLESPDFFPWMRGNGDSFCDPNPHIQGKNMNKNMAPKLPNLPCFEAFGVIFCTDVCSYFCLVCGGRGSLAYF